jgi:hypothetical protein
MKIIMYSNINIKMYVQINLKILDQNHLFQTNTNNLVYSLKNNIRNKYGIAYNFNLFFKGINLNDKFSLKYYDLKNLDSIDLIFDVGYIFIKNKDKTDRVLIKLDNMNNINEKIIDLRKYLDKIYLNYQLKFNDIILKKENNNLTLNQIGMKFYVNQNKLNTLYLI